MAQRYDDALAAMQSRAQTLRTYTCRFISFAHGAEKDQDVTYRYYFKKPSSVRMEVQTGKYEGTVLLYTGSDVRVKPGHGIFSWFSFTFAPTHRYVCDVRGNGLHQSSWLWYITEHARMQRQTRSSFAGFTEIGGRKALKFDLASTDPAKTNSVAREELWIDAQYSVPLQYKQYDAGGMLIQSGRYEEVVIDCEIPDSLFTEFDR